MATAAAPPKKNTADRLAMFVIGIAGVLLALLIYLAVYHAGENKAVAAKDVLNAVLPLIASWVGTVLAYYYSRENLSAATRNATEMAQQLSGAEKLQILRVRDSMIPVDRIDTMKVSDTTPLGEIVEFLRKRSRQRLPIFSERGVLRFIVHLSTINAFISQCALERRPIDALTFGELIAEPAHAELLRTSFGVVGESATLAEAKAALEQGRAREDVFVTRSGGRDEPVVGWITDNDLVRLSRA
jgi:hypothetical protein